jgi:KTSC domain
MTQRITLGSSAIEAVRYNATSRTLDVEFREGHSYRYLYVPEFVYQALLKAESPGAFWNSIKDRFDYVKLD